MLSIRANSALVVRRHSHGVAPRSWSHTKPQQTRGKSRVNKRQISEADPAMTDPSESLSGSGPRNTRHPGSWARANIMNRV
jgi:hypothetical protein